MRALKHLALACLVLATAPAFARAEATAEAAAPVFDAAAKRQAIEAAAKLLIDSYVFPDVGRRAADMLTRNLAAGKYDALTTRVAFAAQLTLDLQALTHDKHLNVWAEGAAPPPDAPVLPPSLFGFSRADRLKGNIGYIVLDSFKLKVLSRQGADTAMTALASTDALIIDLRNNDGGQIDAPAYLVSFFLDAKTPVHVNDILWRKSGTAEYDRQAFTTEPTPVSYVDKPVYVIIGPHTFSAAESYAYEMQARKRAIVVGQVSKGGANPGGFRPIAPGLELSVPAGHVENAITGTSWEGKGVQPDIASPVEQGFATAYAAALNAVGQPKPASAITAETVTEAKLLPPPRTRPAPGGEAALGQLITEMAAGRPPKERLGYTMAWIAETYVSAWQADLTRLGALQGVAFVEVDDTSQDIYEAKFANGSLLFTLVMQPDGKIAWCNYRPKQA